MLKVKKIKVWKDTSFHTAPFSPASIKLFAHPAPAVGGSYLFPHTCSDGFAAVLCNTQHISVEAGIYLFIWTHMSPIRIHYSISGIALPAALLKTLLIYVCLMVGKSGWWTSAEILGLPPFSATTTTEHLSEWAENTGLFSYPSITPCCGYTSFFLFNFRTRTVLQ